MIPLNAEFSLKRQDCFTSADNQNKSQKRIANSNRLTVLLATLLLGQTASKSCGFFVPVKLLSIHCWQATPAADLFVVASRDVLLSTLSRLELYF